MHKIIQIIIIMASKWRGNNDIGSNQRNSKYEQILLSKDKRNKFMQNKKKIYSMIRVNKSLIKVNICND